MKIFMFNKSIAMDNNCYTDTNPNIKHAIFVLLIALDILLPVFGPIIFLMLNMVEYLEVILFLLIVLGIGLLIYHVYSLTRWLAKYEACRRTAVIKENNTFWAVRLTYLPEIIGTVNVNIGTSIYSSILNLKKAQINKKLQAGLYNMREVAENYVEALNESRKSDVIITRDLNQNYKYIFNGKASVIRLDDIKFVKEKKDSDIYSYLENGQTKKIEFFKVYSGLKEEIMNSQPEKHIDTFPKLTKKHKKHFKTNNRAIIIISIIVIILMIFRIILIWN